MKRIVFLGGGNMAAALMAGLRRAGNDTALFAAERNAERRAWLAAQFGADTDETLPVLTAEDVLVLAVKPQDLQAACAGIAHNGALVLSVAAGVETAVLARYLDTRRVVRVMPNTPAAVGQGAAGLFAADGASAADRETAQEILAASGSVLWLDDEAQMHALTAVSGSGPAYVFYLMEALQKWAQAQGFAPEQARDLVLQTFAGAAALAAQSPQDFATLRQQVTSKGGTTAAALAAFDKHAVAAGIAAGAAAAAARSRELAAAFRAA